MLKFYTLDLLLVTCKLVFTRSGWSTSNFCEKECFEIGNKFLIKVCPRKGEKAKVFCMYEDASEKSCREIRLFFLERRVLLNIFLVFVSIKSFTLQFTFKTTSVQKYALLNHLIPLFSSKYFGKQT